jgi:multiple sugar transport system substrate-binding protein
MYIAAPDNVPTLVKQFEGKYEDYGLAPMPGGTATLIGGEGYMINPKASPAKIKAGLTWLQWKFLDPSRMENVVKKYVADKLPVGLDTPPTPAIYTGGSAATIEGLKTKYANIPVRNYAPFTEGSKSLQGKIEPVNAQQLYAILDGVMQGVLTNRDADPARLLDDAQKKVDAALATVK